MDKRNGHNIEDIQVIIGLTASCGVLMVLSTITGIGWGYITATVILLILGSGFIVLKGIAHGKHKEE